MSIITKFMPWLQWIIPAIMLISAGVHYWQHTKIGGLNATLSAKIVTIDVQSQQLAVQKTALDQKDAVIKQQSKSISDLHYAAQANRDAYRRAVAGATNQAAKQGELASELLALKSPSGELAQCRAARDLLEKELTQ